MSFDLRALPAADLLALAREFKSRPFGLHSPMLQTLLDRLRLIHPGGGKLILVCRETCVEWVIGRITGPAQTVTLDQNQRFSSLEAAEWHVFRLRWLEFFGRDLELD